MLAAVKRFYMEVKLQSLCWPGELKDEGRSEASKFEKLAVRHTVIPSWRFVGWAVCGVASRKTVSSVHGSLRECCVTAFGLSLTLAPEVGAFLCCVLRELELVGGKKQRSLSVCYCQAIAISRWMG